MTNPDELLRLAEYRPCRNGIHVCGADEEHDCFYTKENHPLPPAIAMKAFDAAILEFADDDGDYVVDLMLGGDCSADFWIRAQMLPRLAALLRAVAGKGA